MIKISGAVTITVIVIIGILLLGWSAFYWSKHSTPQSPERKRQILYENCVSVNYTNGKSVEDCNNINQPN